jgi:hypothetical protein
VLPAAVAAAFNVGVCKPIYKSVTLDNANDRSGDATFGWSRSTQYNDPNTPIAMD